MAQVPVSQRAGSASIQVLAAGCSLPALLQCTWLPSGKQASRCTGTARYSITATALNYKACLVGAAAPLQVLGHAACGRPVGGEGQDELERRGSTGEGSMSSIDVKQQAEEGSGWR